jgi:RNA polymerase sigma-70 factor (ECF subfamily)
MNDSPHTASRRVLFEETALPFLRRVYNVALRLCQRPEDAGDLTQETYLRAYRTFDNFRTGTDCKAWLLTILYSVFINRYWKHKRQGETVSVGVLDGGYERLLPADSRDVEGDFLRAANLEGPSPEVDDALRELPESFRAAVLLVDVEDMSYEEAAAALRCPVGTLRSRLFRARKLLFTALRGYARLAGYLKASDEH